jgi:hypothetical protein
LLSFTLWNDTANERKELFMESWRVSATSLV